MESIGNLEPDAVVQQGIKVMQQKLAAVIQELTGDEGRGGGDEYEPRSPGVDGAMNGMAVDDYVDAGYTTPFGGGGGVSAWGGGGQTPYGATPYGQNNGWGS